MEQHEIYMHRCLELARLGAADVAPNPLVGSVLVYQDKIIGEGYHKKYGQAHAEVNCINSVKEQDKHLIDKAVIYVSLEPCAHFGKTPPCADLIIKNKIPTVVVGCRDPFEQVDGKGIEKLQDAGIEVITGVLEDQCKKLNKRFFTYHLKQRPYIILKWAQSKNQKIGNADFSRVFISNEFSNRIVHKWRSEESAIIVGTNTAFYDNPSLNVRHWTGRDPVRSVLDLNLRLPDTLQIFDKKQKTIIFNYTRLEDQGNLLYYKLDKELPVVSELMKACYHLQLTSLLVEGGAQLLQSFIDEELWDEARIIENEQLIINHGLDAPFLSNQYVVATQQISGDNIIFYKNKSVI